jgi:hypothetical protein
MPAMVPGDPVDIPAGAPAAQLCDASVTGALADGIPAPPAQLGGTDNWPIDDPLCRIVDGRTQVGRHL